MDEKLTFSSKNWREEAAWSTQDFVGNRIK